MTLGRRPEEAGGGGLERDGGVKEDRKLLCHCNREKKKEMKKKKKKKRIFDAFVLQGQTKKQAFATRLQPQVQSKAAFAPLCLSGRSPNMCECEFVH